MPGTAGYGARVATPCCVAAAVGVIAVSVAVWMVGFDRVVVVVGVLAVTVTAACWTVSAACGDRWPSPSVRASRDERFSDAVARGMDDLSRYLDRHAAFAAYLEHRSAERPSPGATSSDQAQKSSNPGDGAGRVEQR